MQEVLVSADDASGRRDRECLVKPREGRARGRPLSGRPLLVAEHGEQDVAAAAGQADECGLCLFLSLGPFCDRVTGSKRSAANPDRNRDRLRCLFPERAGNSSRMLVSERRVTGAKPAQAARCRL